MRIFPIEQTDRRAVLQRALRDREFVPHYQPILDARTHRIVAIEALARWNRPSGVVGPDLFLADIERHDLHHQLGARMLLAGMRDVQRLRTAQLVDRDTRVHVNVSAVQLDGFHWVGELEECANERGYPLDSLTIELTETSLLQDPALAAMMLGRCRERGVPIALDDMGAGYSSLALLRTVPIDEIKIDRSFVSAVESDVACQAIIAGLVEVGRRLGITVTAEGVERADQDRVLRDLGVDRVQGFLYATPMRFDDVAAFLASN